MREVAGGAGRSIGDALSAVYPFGGGNPAGAAAEQAGVTLGIMGDVLGGLGDPSL